MKKIILISTLFCLTLNLWSQNQKNIHFSTPDSLVQLLMPADNNDPCDPLTLIIGADPLSTTAIEGEFSGVLQSDCHFVVPVFDKWYTCEMPLSGFLQVEVEVGSLSTHGISVYSGNGCGYMAEELCVLNYGGEDDGLRISPLQDLQQEQILIRVWFTEVVLDEMFSVSITDSVLMNVDTNYTPEQLVEDVILGNCMSVQNIEYDGHPSAIGLLSMADADVLGFENSLILGTSSASSFYMKGQNQVGNFETTQTDVESDLSQISSLNDGDPHMHNEAILEFDFIPDFDSISLKFVFASKEYPTYEHTAFNDVLAFFVSGPGISGPYSDNATNIALVPNTELPISISTINGQGGGFGDNAEYFSQYYIGSEMNIGGFTIPINASLNGLIPNETYHLIIAIANGYDHVIGSYLLIEENSFNSYSSTALLPIYESFGLLTAGIAYNYQWYLNGEAIEGATEQQYAPVEDGAYQVKAEDENVCELFSEPYHYFSTTIDELIKNDLKLFPNPFSDQIAIDYETDFTVQVMDTKSIIVFQDEFAKGSNVLDLSYLEKGAYILKIQTAEDRIVRKIIKK